MQFITSRKDLGKIEASFFLLGKVTLLPKGETGPFAWKLLRLDQGIANLFETAGTFGILAEGGGFSHRMAAAEGAASHKMVTEGGEATQIEAA